MPASTPLPLPLDRIDMADGVTGLMMRPMNTSDIPAILEIEKVSFAVPWTRGMFEETLASDITISLVTEEVGRISGYIIFYDAGPEMHIMNIAVHPRQRRHGLAFGMMSRILAFARDNAIEECFLEVRESNVPARGLYKKLGFRSIGRRKEYYSETREDALVMRLSL